MYKVREIYYLYIILPILYNILYQRNRLRTEEVFRRLRGHLAGHLVGRKYIM